MKKYAYGFLNPFFKNRTEANLDPNTTSFLGASKLASLSSFSVNIMENVGAIKGVALYAWKEANSENGPAGLEIGISEILCVKVRIPELHMFPKPGKLPTANDPGDEEADWDTISLYPTFYAKDTTVTKLGLPQPGQLVYVNFENRDRQDGPLFLGSIDLQANIGGAFPQGDLSDRDTKLPAVTGTFDPSGKKVEDMFTDIKTGKRPGIYIIKSMALTRLKHQFMKELEAYLKQHVDPGYTVRSLGLKRSAGASITVKTGGWRVAGGKHATGMAMDMKIEHPTRPNQNLKSLKQRNFAMVEDKKLVKAISDFTNLPKNDDVRWGGMFPPKRTDRQSADIYYDRAMSLLSGRQRRSKVVASEFHHFEIAATAYHGANGRKYWDRHWIDTGNINVAYQLGFKRPPLLNPDLVEFLKRVTKYLHARSSGV